MTPKPQLSPHLPQHNPILLHTSLQPSARRSPDLKLAASASHLSPPPSRPATPQPPQSQTPGGVQDELNVFTGILDSRIFLYIMAAVVGLQLIIMLTPLATFFRVTHQSGLEWAFAVGVGAVSLPLALLTKLVTRCVR